ncbi:MAG: insulinase family protein, partial [Deltaproteobacteria bacterium]|nr:insulinase family protein [Deltaproteobacteria bacterium]
MLLLFPLSQAAGLRLATEGGLLETTLESGLRVVIVGDPVLRTTAIAHRVHAGAALDPDGKEGTAHLVEHLLFEAADSAGTFSERVDAEGGWANAWTSYDDTLYLTSVLPTELRAALALEGQRMTRPLDASALDQERAVVADELRLRAGLEPGARLVSGLHGALAAGHPYGRPLGGDDASLAAIGAADVTAYFEAHYGGSTMQLVIVGPHDPRDVLPVVKTAYAGLRADAASPPPPRLPELARGPLRL